MYDSINQKLEDGDQIEFERGDLQHWGIYDNGFVIHVNAPGNSMHEYQSGRLGQLADAAFGNIYTVIKKDKLEDVVLGCKYYKNNQLDKKCKPYPQQEIVNRARKLVGQKWNYYLFSQNCEHFVNEMRYGKSTSFQAIAVGVATAGLCSGALITAATVSSTYHVEDGHTNQKQTLDGKVDDV